MISRNVVGINDKKYAAVCWSNEMLKMEITWIYVLFIFKINIYVVLIILLYRYIFQFGKVFIKDVYKCYLFLKLTGFYNIVHKYFFSHFSVNYSK